MMCGKKRVATRIPQTKSHSFQAYEENGLKRPLMAPRRKGGKPASKTNKTVTAIMRKRNRYWKCCEPFCYALAALIVLIAIIFLAAYLLTMFPVSLQKIKLWIRQKDVKWYENALNSEYELFKGEMTPCTMISVQKVWSKAYSKLSSESPVRKLDLNGDGNEDIVLGYGVDDSIQYGAESPVPKCELDDNGYRAMVFCEGGILALDGVTGNTLWQRWTEFNVFSISCFADLNSDGQVDCVVSGRGGVCLVEGPS